MRAPTCCLNSSLNTQPSLEGSGPGGIKCDWDQGAKREQVGAVQTLAVRDSTYLVYRKNLTRVDVD